MPRYNAATARVKQEFQVPVKDLNARVTPAVAKLQRKDDVHFGLKGSEFLAKQVAEQVAEQIAAALPGK